MSEHIGVIGRIGTAPGPGGPTITPGPDGTVAVPWATTALPDAAVRPGQVVLPEQAAPPRAAVADPVQHRPFPDRQAVLRAAALVPVALGRMDAAHPVGPLPLATTTPAEVSTGGLHWDGAAGRLVLHPRPDTVVAARIEILTVAEHPLGTAAVGPDGRIDWPARARLGDTPVVWDDHTDRPAEGSRHPCFLAVTGESRAVLIQAEGEHSLDFNEALLRVTGALADALDRVPAGLDRPAAIARLVVLLIDAGARYLVPADPYDLAAWEPRLGRAYLALNEQARQRRDGTPDGGPAPHRPLRYRAALRADPPGIVLTPVLPRNGQWLPAMDPAALDLPCYGATAR
ncbi:hypothetical protein ACIQBJ_30385 [Kitasatospora sp. NPDC088391]|uniref:hypothetical protein n=1 Tax=Kitasatospora sp. NPDC088391 TaxID=3364074 RepID=UPI00380B668F